MAKAAANHETAQFWDDDNTRRGSFSWSLMPPSALAAEIAAEVGSAAAERAARILVLGAGTSEDCVRIASALGVLPSRVTAADFSAVAVAHQAALGVTAVRSDIVASPRADWAGAWDIVVDAAFTDVFMSSWKGDAGPRRQPPPNAAAALRAVRSFLAPGGLLVVKSMVQSEEEYAAYVRAVLRVDYTPQRVIDAARMFALATEGARSFSGGTSRAGRVRKLSLPNFSVMGHVGLWRPKDNPKAPGAAAGAAAAAAASSAQPSSYSSYSASSQKRKGAKQASSSTAAAPAAAPEVTALRKRKRAREE